MSDQYIFDAQTFISAAFVRKGGTWKRMQSKHGTEGLVKLMEYRTADGVEFYVLPDGARCTYTRKHPDNMNTCPIDGDEVCCTDECGYYKEYSGYEKRRKDG